MMKKVLNNQKTPLKNSIKKSVSNEYQKKRSFKKVE